MEQNEREKAVRIAEAAKYADLLSRVLRDCLLSCDYGRSADRLRWWSYNSDEAAADLDRMQREVWQ
jgi:hypothetical protein